MAVIHESYVQKSSVVVIESGEDPVSALTQLARDGGIPELLT